MPWSAARISNKITRPLRMTDDAYVTQAEVGDSPLEHLSFKRAEALGLHTIGGTHDLMVPVPHAKKAKQTRCRRGSPHC